MKKLRILAKYLFIAVFCGVIGLSFLVYNLFSTRFVSFLTSSHFTASPKGAPFCGRIVMRPYERFCGATVGAIHESPVSLPGRLFSYTRYSPVISPPVMAAAAR